ncbi:hypothetical protein [Nocardia vaccinii]|uniref:hypothetical protein n=1 Tax=Nocardia vaccinii TaxID=1822 RepID=UPI0035A23E96
MVVGASIAGVTAVRELRALGHRGAITMIGADPHGSSARPPLSKAVLEDSTADATLGYGSMISTSLACVPLRWPLISTDARS